MEFKLKDYNLKDTVCAIATFPSKSALGVIKISGKKSLDIVSKIFLPKKKKDIKKAKTYTLHYGWIIDKSKKKEVFIDEVLVSIMRAPFSYTREDVVEISSHGGILVLNKILELILRNKARLALPGEFTYRAVINGRINLLEAESILAIVEAKTQNTLDFAVRQLKGEANKKFEELKNQIKEVFVQTESLINFPEEEIEIPLKDIERDLEKIEKQIELFLKTTQFSDILKEGLKCVICGKANAGKSTLFNRLLKQERVLVSRIPGTTRDVIEETIDIRGVPLRIYDTAGIFEPKDLITKKAIEKTKKTFQEADLVIFVLDGSRPLNKDDFFLWEKVKNKNTILVINKIDLKQRLKPDIFEDNIPKVYLSALKNIGIKDLEEMIFKMVYQKGLDRESLLFLSNFQKEILLKVKKKLIEAKNFLKEGYSIDFVNFSLRECLDELRKLTGEVFCEEILESIFSNFCIGK
jgi:tRNA modification GTPase